MNSMRLPRRDMSFLIVTVTFCRTKDPKARLRQRRGRGRRKDRQRTAVDRPHGNFPSRLFRKRSKAQAAVTPRDPVFRTAEKREPHRPLTHARLTEPPVLSGVWSSAFWLPARPSVLPFALSRVKEKSIFQSQRNDACFLPGEGTCRGCAAAGFFLFSQRHDRLTSQIRF